MREKKNQENFPGQITLFIILPVYLFINLFCFKYLVANEFFFQIQNQIKADLH